MKKRQQKKIEKKMAEKKVETKDYAGSGTLNQIGVPSAVTDNASATDVDTPQTSTSSWPAPNLWYAQGKDAAKKAYFDYINAMNQYFSTPDDQPDRKLEMAGKMNSLVTSMIQGVAIGVESLENTMRKVRIGDQAARLEKDVTVDTLTRLLKTIHTHNSAAYSGKLAGLEVKLIEPSLMSRLNRVEPMGVTSMGIPLANAEEADTLWVEDIPTVPPTQAEVPLDQSTDEIPLDDIQNNEEPLPEQGAEGEVETTSGDEEIPLEDIQAPEEDRGLPPTDERTPEEEQTIPEGEEATPQADAVAPTEEVVPQDEFPAEEEEGAEPIVPEQEMEQVAPDEDLTQEEATPPPDGLPLEDGSTEEAPVDETGQMQEEVPVDQEEFVKEEIPAEGVVAAAPTDPNALKMQLMELVDTDPAMAAQLLVQAQGSGEKPVATDEQQETPVDDEDMVYCYGCEKEVTRADIDACQQPDCPFKQAGAEEEEVISETPSEESSPEEVSEKTDEEEPKKKHYVITDHDDHSECDVHQITIKGFTGIDGEYCLTHGKLIHYAFDQNEFDAEQAKAWVQKQFKANKIKNKTAEEIVIEKIDSLDDVQLKAWLSPKVEKGLDEVEIDAQTVMDTMERVFKQAFQQQIVEPFDKRLKDLEA